MLRTNLAFFAGLPAMPGVDRSDRATSGIEDQSSPRAHAHADVTGCARPGLRRPRSRAMQPAARRSEDSVFA